MKSWVPAKGPHKAQTLVEGIIKQVSVSRGDTNIFLAVFDKKTKTISQITFQMQRKCKTVKVLFNDTLISTTWYDRKSLT